MKKGFTLIELIMVIVILGILAATALPRFIDIAQQSRIAAAKGAIAGVRSAIAIAYASNAAYGTASFPTAIGPEIFQKWPITEPLTGGTTFVNVTAPPTGAGVGYAYDSVNGLVWINNAAYTDY